MIRRAWMMALVGLGLVVVNVPGLGAARESDVGEADIDAEVTQFLNEMGGSDAVCPQCPPGTNCCTAVCIISCCTVVCPPGAVPDCSCNFMSGSARCFCAAPDPGCNSETFGIGFVSRVVRCFVDISDLIELSIHRL